MAQVFKVGAVTVDFSANIKDLVSGLKQGFDSLTKFTGVTNKAEKALADFGSRGKKLEDSLKSLQRRKDLLIEKMKTLSDAGDTTSYRYKGLANQLSAVTDRIQTQNLKIDEFRNKYDKAVTITDRFKNSLQSLKDKSIELSKTGFTKLVDGLKSIARNAVATTIKLGKLGAGAVIALGGFALKASADIEQLKTSLLTTYQGNEQGAKQAFEQITNFAKSTPNQLDEVLQGFIKLKNRGLDPSERALKSYGDTSSAMGKSLNDMVEAVADAATGEFERLKEFGIKASSQGDKVKFTFRGVETTVKKDAKSIENYLIGLGEVNFAGGMERQSKTIKGAFSTLKDNIFLTFADISEKSGLSNFIRNGLLQLNDWFTKNEGTITSFIDNAVINLKKVFEEQLIPTFNYFKDNILPGLIDFWNNRLIPAFNYFKDVVLPALVNFWGSKLAPALSRLIKAFFRLWDLVSPVLVPALEHLYKFLGFLLVNAINLLAGTFNFLAGAIEVGKNAFNGIKNTLMGVYNFFGDLINRIKEIIGLFGSLQNKAKELSFGNINSGLAKLVENAKRRASGGPVKPGRLYEVGEENKAEMFLMGNKQYMIPGNKGDVLNQDQLSRKQTNQKVININNYNQGQGPSKFYENYEFAV